MLLATDPWGWVIMSPKLREVYHCKMIHWLFLAISCSFLLAQGVHRPVPRGDVSEAVPVPRVAPEDAEQDFKARRFVAAKSKLRDRIAHEPADGAARYLLVRALIEENHPNDALEEAGTAVRDCPRHALAHTALGDARYRLGEFDQARAAYEDALRINPKEARAHLGLGRVLLTDFRFKSARDHFRAAHDITPADPDAAGALASVLPGSPTKLALEEQYVNGATYRDPEEVEANRALTVLSRIKRAKRTYVVEDSPRTVSLKLRGVRTLTNGPLSAFVLPVRINASGPHNLLVDSAAHGILISARIARLSGVAALVPYRLGGLGDRGRMSASLGWADTVSLGDLRLRDCPVIISDKRIGPRWDGIIGTDVLRDFLITLDFPGRTLRLEKLPTRKGDEYSHDRPTPGRPGFTPVRTIGWKLLARTAINGRLTAHFIIDTGASEGLIGQETAKPVATVTPTRRRIKGVSGAVTQLLQAENVSLDFLGLHRTPETMLAVDLAGLSYAVGTEIGGLIGCPQIADTRLTIDYQQGLVKLTK